MPRNAEKVRCRLQEAALELFEARGYEPVTAADIAAAAGVTQRTFFRHFSDKREVLFGGEHQFIAALQRGVSIAPRDFGPWETLRHALRATEPIFVANRAFSMPRQRIIATHPTLQERAQTKIRDVVTALASSLGERGVPERSAMLAAQIAMAAMHQAVSAWFANEATALGDQIDRAFSEVGELSSPLTHTGSS
jgi:AcrR family transcriptional regulator